MHVAAAIDDPMQRHPDTTVAKEQVGWQPRFSLLQGLEETTEYFGMLLKEDIAKAQTRREEEYTTKHDL